MILSIKSSLRGKGIFELYLSIIGHARGLYARLWHIHKDWMPVSGIRRGIDVSKYLRFLPGP